ncbi:MAG: glycoside hydrolase family 11 protein, partial [Actinoplanes sp.]
MNDIPTEPRRRGRLRLLLGATCAAALAIAGTVIASPNAYAEADRTVSSNTTGTHNGYYFSFWKDGGNASMTLRADGRYSSSWDRSTNNWVGGKGWATGSRRTVSSNTTGTHNGYYFSFWKDSGNASMTLRENGRYSSSWDRSTNNWVGGKGWATGTRRSVTY